jgi:hypothetical protein
MIGFIVILVFAILYYIVFRINYKIHTNKLLKEHQLEWDEMKQKLKDKGATEQDILDKYCEYNQHLLQTRHRKYGACFPHI